MTKKTHCSHSHTVQTNRMNRKQCPHWGEALKIGYHWKYNYGCRETWFRKEVNRMTMKKKTDKRMYTLKDLNSVPSLFGNRRVLVLHRIDSGILLKCPINWGGRISKHNNKRYTIFGFSPWCVVATAATFLRLLSLQVCVCVCARISKGKEVQSAAV